MFEKARAISFNAAVDTFLSCLSSHVMWVTQLYMLRIEHVERPTRNSAAMDREYVRLAAASQRQLDRSYDALVRAYFFVMGNKAYRADMAAAEALLLESMERLDALALQYKVGQSSAVVA